MNIEHIEWLKSQLPELIKKEILSEENAQKIQQHYAMDALSTKASVSIFTVILAAI